MSKAEYALLQDVIMDADFPDLDLALRRGRHIDRDDAAWYSLLTDAQELLEPFYRRYGCELIHKTDGYFYLLPTGEKVSRKQLAATDMLVGQALALLYLDPAAVERGGVVSQEEVVSQLSAVLGSDALIGVFSPGKRKVKDERIAQRNVRQRVGEAVRRLAVLGFVEVSDESSVRLRAALLRFAEPVRGLSEPAEALAKLVAQGEVALAPDEPGDAEDADESGEDEPERTTLVGVPAPSEGRGAFSKPVFDGVVQSSAAAVGGAEAVATAAADGGGTPNPLDQDLAADEAGERDVPAATGSAGGEALHSASLYAAPAVDGAAESAGLGAADDARDDEVARRGFEAQTSGPDRAATRMTETLVGIAAPSGLYQSGADANDDALESFDSDADHDDLDEPDENADANDDAPQPERSAVVRKPRAPVSDDDLDWADILVPEPDDAEDGT